MIATKFLAALLLATLFFVPAARSQDRPEKGSHELEVWAGGGHGLSGSTSDTSVFNVGLRYGWVLTAPHGPGFLRGTFEYAVDAVPIFVVVQRTKNAFGAGVNPVNLKWNFETRGSVVPYVEIGGGTLFTNNEVPLGTSNVNFTSGAAFGLHVLRSRINWGAEVRYMHISNAGLSSPNPGINTIQFRLTFGRFKH